MVSPLSGKIAATIGKAMSSLFLDATLTRDVVTLGTNDPSDPPAPTPTVYTCKAIVERYSDYYRANGMVDAKDRKVLILATSLSARPALNDRITMGGITFVAVNVATDPAEAVWEIQGRV